MFNKRIMNSPKNFNDITLENVIYIEDKEKSNKMLLTINILNQDIMLQKKYFEVCWKLKAIYEYEDICSGSVMNGVNGRIFSGSYCYYEGIRVLTEGILSGLDGYYYASFSTLRTSLELILFNSYWKTKLNNQKKAKDFLKWLNGGKYKPAFSEIKNDFRINYKHFNEWNLIKNIGDIYSKLCSYSHTPNINESILSISQTNNKSVIEKNSLIYWLDIANETIDILLKILITTYPMSLFPLNLINKFGLNRIAGIYFDKYNFSPINMLFKLEDIEKVRAVFKNTPDYENYYSFYNSLPNKSLEEIKETLDKKEIDNDELYNQLLNLQSINEDDWETAWLLMKTKFRLILEVQCYNYQ